MPAEGQATDARTSPEDVRAATSRPCSFNICVTLDPAANRSAARGSVNGTPARCVVEISSATYLPGRLSCTETPRSHSVAEAVLTTLIADGEATDYFATGQRFTIWADVIVGDRVRGDGLIGWGTVCGAESPATSATSQAPTSRSPSAAALTRLISPQSAP